MINISYDALKSCVYQSDVYNTWFKVFHRPEEIQSLKLNINIVYQT